MGNGSLIHNLAADVNIIIDLRIEKFLKVIFGRFKRKLPPAIEAAVVLLAVPGKPIFFDGFRLAFRTISFGHRSLPPGFTLVIRNWLNKA
jgi:hypothetical protein